MANAQNQECHPLFGKKFVCARCRAFVERAVKPVEKLCDEVETVNGFCYLGDKLNASGGVK